MRFRPRRLPPGAGASLPGGGRGHLDGPEKTAPDHVEEIAGAAVPLIVAGDSAGGCLAAVMAQRSRSRPAVALQVLVYPVSGATWTATATLEPETSCCSPRETMAWFWDHYAPDPAERWHRRRRRRAPPTSPGCRPPSVLTAEYDVLRDEGNALRTEDGAGGRARRAPALRRPDAPVLHAAGHRAGERRRPRLRRGGRRTARWRGTSSTPWSVGAGFAGLYMLHRLRGLGLPARLSRPGDGVGGTWFWNRYPGARCDTESLDYSYSSPTSCSRSGSGASAIPAQPEIQRYLEHARRASSCGPTSSSGRA